VESRIRRRGRQVEPEPLAIPQAGKAYPAQDARLIPSDLERDRGRSALKKMNAADLAGTFHEKPPHAMAGKTMKIILRSGQRKADELDEPLASARQVFAQTQKANAVFAKRVQAHRHGLAVGPKRLITLE